MIQTDTMDFVELMKNKNTKSKTRYDVKKVCDWFGDVDNLEEIPPSELNLHLARFFLNIKKKDGSDYEPDSLKSIHLSLHRYLSDKKYSANILTDEQFKHSRDVLLSKRKLLKQSGNKKQRADPFTDEEIEILKKKELLGAANPEAMINTLWMNNTLHFGLRGRQEHVTMLCGDIDLDVTASGREFLSFTERATKTRNGVTTDPRQFSPKMFAQPGDPFCPVALYKAYADKRPETACQPDSRFYLSVNPHYGSRPGWFINLGMGKNTLGQLAKRMSEKAEFTARHVNHSARKTCITKLLDAQTPPQRLLKFQDIRIYCPSIIIIL